MRFFLLLLNIVYIKFIFAIPLKEEDKIVELYNELKNSQEKLFTLSDIWPRPLKGEEKTKQLFNAFFCLQNIQEINKNEDNEITNKQKENLDIVKNLIVENTDSIINYLFFIQNFYDIMIRFSEFLIKNKENKEIDFSKEYFNYYAKEIAFMFPINDFEEIKESCQKIKSIQKKSSHILSYFKERLNSNKKLDLISKQFCLLPLMKYDKNSIKLITERLMNFKEELLKKFNISNQESVLNIINFVKIFEDINSFKYFLNNTNSSPFIFFNLLNFFKTLHDYPPLNSFFIFSTHSRCQLNLIFEKNIKNILSIFMFINKKINMLSIFSTWESYTFSDLTNSDISNALSKKIEKEEDFIFNNLLKKENKHVEILASLIQV